MSKPVAWMNEYEQICHATDKRMEEIANNISSPRNYFNYTIPLYTHPVKQLSDEEIMEICITGGVYDCINDPYIQKDGTCSLDKDLIRFARAIIKEITE